MYLMDLRFYAVCSFTNNNRQADDIKYQYCTIFHSILQCNRYLHHDIYCDSGLPYYTRLIKPTNHIFILFSSKCNDDVLFLSYNHLHI